MHDLLLCRQTALFIVQNNAYRGCWSPEKSEVDILNIISNVRFVVIVIV